MKENKLMIQDLISIGVFTAIYFVLVTIATFATSAIIPGLSYVLIPVVSALISGCVYMLLVVKIQKFGAITIMELVMSIFFFSSGHFILSFVTNIVFAIIADLIGYISKYKNKAMILLSYIVFSYGLMGPVLPMWFLKDQYVSNLVARGKDAVYIERLFEYINMGTFRLCIVAILIGSIIGGLFGIKMIKKQL